MGSFGDGRTELGGHGFAFELKEARSLGAFKNGPGLGLSWITERRLGAGRIILLGAAPSHTVYTRIIERAADGKPFAHSSDVTWGSAVAPRESESGGGWVVTNWDGVGGSVTLPKAARDHLTGQEFPAGKLTLQPFDAFVLEWV